MISVLVTRPAQQAENLCALLVTAGLKVERLPLLEIVPLPITADALSFLAESPPIDWFIFISTNAVNFALALNDGRIPDYLKQSQLAAVGEATAKALQQAGFTVKAVPASGFTSEAVLAMPAFQHMQGQRCVIVRGCGGREELATVLRQRGAQVDYWEVYARQAAVHDPQQLIAWLQQTSLKLITISSAEALDNLLRLLSASVERMQLLKIPLVVISERLATIAKAEGFQQVFVSAGVNDNAVVNKIIDLVSGESSG